MSADGTASAFRRRRGRILAAKIGHLASSLGRGVRIFDVGGRRDYWDNIGFSGIGSITLLNVDEADLARPCSRPDLFVDQLGDARDLSGTGSDAFDLYHSNSVIEHVGGWADMKSMAREAVRVAPAGWIQTPAFEFPIEPHFRLPFIHWFGTPIRSKLLWFAKAYRDDGIDQRRLHAERINLLSRGEVNTLFPARRLRTERFLLLPKSYVVEW